MSVTLSREALRSDLRTLDRIPVKRLGVRITGKTTVRVRVCNIVASEYVSILIAVTRGAYSAVDLWTMQVEGRLRYGEFLPDKALCCESILYAIIGSLEKCINFFSVVSQLGMFCSDIVYFR